MYNFIVYRVLGVALKLHIVTDHAPKRPDTSMVFVHGIGSSHRMWRRLQHDLRKRNGFERVSFISVDLLGFGKSPRPRWASYDTTRQARSLRRALKKYTRGTKVVVVGHSLGSLVAIEYAKTYSQAINKLVLCSPPFYRQLASKLPTRDSLLQKAYEEFAKNSKRSEKILLAMQKYTFLNEGYSIDKTNSAIFIRTLKSSIMNQTAYTDALAIKTRTYILSGMLDPVVIDANISSLTKKNPAITRKRIALAAHEISPLYRKELVKTLSDIIA